MIVYALTENSVTIMGLFLGACDSRPDDFRLAAAGQPLDQRAAQLPLTPTMRPSAGEIFRSFWRPCPP
jgi:hypothetical protein